MLIETRPEQIKEAHAGIVENLDIFVETVTKTCMHLRVKRRKGQLSLRLYLDSARGGGGLNNTYAS